MCGKMVALLVAEVESRVANPDFDLPRLALRMWAEALRDPALIPALPWPRCSP